MENSELQTQVINLGKLLVKEMQLEPGVDTFAKWMAHYIAEKIILAENASSVEEKKNAEKECFDTILKFWAHRWLLPSNRRPLREFEPILKTIERINPEKEEPFFYNSFDEDFEKIEKENPELKKIVEYATMLVEIDKVARIWIDFILHKAALLAKSEKIKKYLDNSANLIDNDDTKIIRIIFDDDPSLDFEIKNQEAIQKKYRLEKLKKRMEALDKFSKLNEFLQENYRRELESIQK
jgi:hypothetical protein